MRFIFVGINHLLSKLKSKQNNWAMKYASAKLSINYLIREAQKTCYNDNDDLTETSSAVSVQLQLPELHRLALFARFGRQRGHSGCRWTPTTFSVAV